MILILLVSTLQFSLYKMECLLSGNTTLSLSEFEDCNKKPINHSSFSEKCCNFINITFDFDYNTNISFKEFKCLKSPIVLKQTSIIPSELIANNSPRYFYNNLPPPSGKELLKRVQVFRL